MKKLPVFLKNFTLVLILVFSTQIQELQSQELVRFRAHQRSEGLNKALISPKGDFILTAGKDSTAQIWNLKGEKLHTFYHDKPNVSAIAISADAKLIATGGQDKMVRLWQVSNKKLNYTLPQDENIKDLTFSKDGKYLVVAEQKNRLRIYEANTGKLYKELPLRANWANKIAISPQSDRVIGAWGYGLNYYQFPDGKKIEVFDDLAFEKDAIQPKKNNAALFSPDGKTLLTWYSGNFNINEAQPIHSWNSQTAQHLKTYEGISANYEIVYTPDGKYLLIGGDHWQDKDFTKNTGTIHLIKAETGQALAQIKAHKLGITSMAFSDDGKYFITAGGDNREVILWDAEKLLATRNISQTTPNTNKAKDTKPQITSTESIDLDDIDLSTPDTKYYALIISINDYEDKKIKKLEEPEKDAKRFKNTLEAYYSFDAEHSTHLANPTRAQIITELDKLSRKVTESDNLLIFYAGHGYWDEDLQQGYWLPADAQSDYRANWLANSELGNYIRGIKSKHTLLITDACFSGSIFENTRNAFDNAPQHIQNLYARSSRKAMTSGMKEEVPDKSIFLQYLIKGLEENEKKYLTAGELFNFIIEPVLSNTSNAPQFGVIRNTKHEGGDFIFIKK